VSRATFEGSYLGDAAKIGRAARMECKVCWYVYDPQLGDATWRISAGTAFAELPGHWRCPRCDGERAQFLVLQDEAGA